MIKIYLSVSFYDFVLMFQICFVTLSGAIPTPQNDASSASLTSSGATSSSGNTGNGNGEHRCCSTQETAFCVVFVSYTLLPVLKYDV